MSTTTLDYTPLFAGKLSPKHEANLTQLIKNCERLYKDEDNAILRNKVISDIIDGYVNGFYTKNLIEVIPVSQPCFDCPITGKENLTVKTHKGKYSLFDHIDYRVIDIIEAEGTNRQFRKMDLYNYIKLLKKDDLKSLNFYCSNFSIENNSFNVIAPPAVECLMDTSRLLGVDVQAEWFIPHLKENQLLIHKKDITGILFYPLSFFYTRVAEEGEVPRTAPLSRYHIEITKQFKDAYELITIVE
jgi:hypothetical protein